LLADLVVAPAGGIELRQDVLSTGISFCQHFESPTPVRLNIAPEPESRGSEATRGVHGARGDRERGARVGEMMKTRP
jgi:hypothetical protein